MTKTKTYEGLKKIPASTLPRKLSKTIRVALKDLAAIEKSSRFVVDMSQWFSRLDTENKQASCGVCLAGSVMARTLGVSLEILSEKLKDDCGSYTRGSVSPAAFKRSITWKLFALDNIRNYDVVGAVEYFYGKKSRERDKLLCAVERGEITLAGYRPSYERDRYAWRQNISKIADDLESLGL